MIVRWFIVYIIGVHRYQHRSAKASESSPHHKMCKISQGCCFSRSVDPSLRLEAKFKHRTAIALGFCSGGVWGSSHFWTQFVIVVRICPSYFCRRCPVTLSRHLEFSAFLPPCKVSRAQKARLVSDGIHVEWMNLMLLSHHVTMQICIKSSQTQARCNTGVLVVHFLMCVRRVRCARFTGSCG